MTKILALNILSVQISSHFSANIATNHLQNTFKISSFFIIQEKD